VGKSFNQSPVRFIETKSLSASDFLPQPAHRIGDGRRPAGTQFASRIGNIDGEQPRVRAQRLIAAFGASKRSLWHACLASSSTTRSYSNQPVLV